MFNFKKNVAVALSLFATFPTLVLAQVEENSVATRDRLVQKYKNNKPFMVMFYNGRNLELDMNKTFNKYLPYANYLSDKFDRLVIFDVDTSPDNLTKDVLDTADLVYTSPLLFNKMEEYGWKPLVIRNNPVSPSYIVRKSDNINSVLELKDKKIISPPGIVSDYALYDLITSDVYKNQEEARKFLKNKTSIDSQVLIKDVLDKQADVLILRDKEAKKLAGGSDKLKIIKSNVVGPDLIIYYNPKNNVIDYNKVKNVFLGMTDENLQAKEVLVSAREFTPGENIQFLEFNTKNKDFIEKVLAITKN